MPRKTTDDPELQAMITVVEWLDRLDAAQRQRLLDFLTARYASDGPPPRATWPGQADKQLGQADGRPVEVVHP